MQSLVVFVKGVPRQITGSVQDATTNDLIQALAQADHHVGKFMLVAVNPANQVEYFLRSGEVPSEVIRNSIAQQIELRLEMREVEPEHGMRNFLPRSRSLSNAKSSPPDYIPNRLSTPTLNAINAEELSYANCDLDALNLTRTEVESIILYQMKLIEEYKEKLAQLSAEMNDKTDNEFLQLVRQHKNLKRTIEQLETGKWEEKRKKEAENLDGIQTAIDAMTTAMNNKKVELNEVLFAQTQLTYQMKHFQHKQFF
ncbi:unnamed protein product [Bursaphelenchus okinawaensis]|uniref:Ras-associating domain-containing protein n=1 Tax=Bursaphelenchus okinawaensis TaxID=465554 RepID=A0A811KK80_9BILA|nr:unnamed protein product [Bursaphelenchus okinawaensis]CAG9104594.1 unnamed protein product [Bursaphelenchus okinawaensis]